MNLIPDHLQIETVNSLCTARCIMCPFETWTRKPNIMNNKTFEIILKKFVPFKDYINYLSLFGIGEPLLDKDLPEKISIAKKLGFKGTGLASNCTELNEKKSIELLKANLDTIICSIDGIKKETHEAIRVGTNFDVIKSNVENFIRLRDENGYKTRVLLRIILQEKNRMEYSDYYNYWSNKINSNLGDGIINFDIVHTYNHTPTNLTELNKEDKLLEIHYCKELFERLFVYSNGDVALCCYDNNDSFYELGNVIKEDPIKIFNNEIFKRYRTMIMEGKIKELKYCNNCTIPRSHLLKNF